MALNDPKAKVRNSALELLCVLVQKEPNSAPLVEEMVGPDFSYRVLEKLQYGVLPTLNYDGIVEFSNKVTDFGNYYQAATYYPLHHQPTDDMSPHHQQTPAQEYQLNRTDYPQTVIVNQADIAGMSQQFYKSSMMSSSNQSRIDSVQDTNRSVIQSEIDS